MLIRHFQLLLIVIGVWSSAGCTTLSSSQPSRLVIEDDIESFERVDAVVTNLSQQYGADNVLVVLDIDNTLMTSTSDLGGDIWYQWQRGRLDVKPTKEQQVKCLFEDAIGLLYELNPMRLTDPSLPEKMQGWQSQGNVVFALTSRSPKYRAATERELMRLQLDLTQSALSKSGQPPLVLRENAGREWSYMRGIMMTTGMNKGVMLRRLLGISGQEFSAIVFVDDTRQHIDDVSAAFTTNENLDVRVFHYVSVEKQRERVFGSVLTQAQAGKMASDWQALTATLNSVFPERALTAGCLGN